MSEPLTATADGLRWITASLATDAVESYSRALSYPDLEAGLDALARAIGATAGSGGLLAAAAPRRPPPRLALLVAGGDEVEAGLAAQISALEHTCRELRFIGYREADRIAARLARRLESRYEARLRRCRLSAIPRGGWLAAGLLAAHLEHSSWTDGAAASRRVRLIIDDCAFTGIALRRRLDAAPGGPVIFAPLAASPRLCREIERREPRVEAVVSGLALAESTGGLAPADYERWRRSWRERSIQPPYWLGMTEFVCFPWNEPRRWVWNPATRSVEPGWPLLARERCLDARHGAPPPPPSPIRPGGEVVAAELDGAIHVGDLRSGESWRLAGTAAVFWRALVGHGDRGRAVAEVVKSFEVEAGAAGRDLDRWLGELTARGLLEP